MVGWSVDSFGQASQPFGDAAHKFLIQFLDGKHVQVRPLSIDQYGRVVAAAWLRRSLRWVNVSEELLRVGLASVYTAQGAQYDGRKLQFLALEKKAKKRRVGMWRQNPGSYVSPGEFKAAAKSTDTSPSSPSTGKKKHNGKTPDGSKGKNGHKKKKASK